MLTIKVLQGKSNVGDVFQLETGGVYVVGRSDSADIQLRSSGVSKNHCRLHVLPGNRLEVEDLNSSNGTFINGLQVKKSVMKPGDSLTLDSFVLKLIQKKPDAIVSIPRREQPIASPSPFDGNAAFELGAAPAPQMNAETASAPRAPESLAEKVESFLASNIYPIADTLSSQFDLRFLAIIFFLLWSMLIIFFSAWPFSSAANERVRTQNLEVARLYARQLSRVNAEFIVNEEYRNLINTLDKVQGQTPGIIETYIIDAGKQSILAPVSDLGRSFANPYAQRAIEKLTGSQNPHTDFVADDGRGNGYAATPLMINTSEGNKTVAIAFVHIDTRAGNFTTADLFDQIISALLYSLIASFLFLIILYRWLNGSIVMLSQRIDSALKTNQSTVQVPVILPTLKELSERISYLLSKAQSSSGSSQDTKGGDSSPEWALSFVSADAVPACALDVNGRVLAWNGLLENLLGVAAADALQREFSQVSRNLEADRTVRALMTDASLSGPWTTRSQTFSFDGNTIKTSVTYNAGIFLVMMANGGSS